jgi:DNA-binding CsgD family transcriptional regulator
VTQSPENNFAHRLSNIQQMADELPVALIIHQVSDMRIVYMNQPGLDDLGTNLKDIRELNTDQYFVRYFNSEDSNNYTPKIMHIINTRSSQQVSYFQQVRTILSKEWKLYVSNSKAFAWSKDGEVTHLITIASMLDPVHHITSKVNRVMDEVNFLRDNNPLFLKLTKREKEVLVFMATGLNSGEIADKLFISSTTADTHRRNIRNKLGLKNNYDAVKFAQAYNLI